jgi:hypothetical protein
MPSKWDKIRTFLKNELLQVSHFISFHHLLLIALLKIWINLWETPFYSLSTFEASLA